MRKPAGTGFCCAIISFTLATALAVRLIGATFLTSGTVVVVAIRISLALKLFDYSKNDPLRSPSRPGDRNHLYDLDADCKGEVALFQFCNRLFQQGLNHRRGLAIRAIIVPLRPSPGLYGVRVPQSAGGKPLWLGRLCRGGL